MITSLTRQTSIDVSVLPSSGVTSTFFPRLPAGTIAGQLAIYNGTAWITVTKQEEIATYVSGTTWYFSESSVVIGSTVQIYVNGLRQTIGSTEDCEVTWNETNDRMEIDFNWSIDSTDDVLVEYLV